MSLSETLAGAELGEIDNEEGFRPAHCLLRFPTIHVYVLS